MYAVSEACHKHNHILPSETLLSFVYPFIGVVIYVCVETQLMLSSCSFQIKSHHIADLDI